ncbi:MAG: tetratricopeptide repeat protein [Caldilineaceae bacterium]
MHSISRIDPSSASAPAQVDLPSSLQSLILSRIDQLAENEQTTLRAASIIGRSFRVAWLSGYFADLGVLTHVKAHLDQLHAFDMTLPAKFEAELTYLFKHMVTYEVTYDSLPFATRSRLHERLARFLEAQIAVGTLNESSVLDALVHHYTHSDNKDKQRLYLEHASVAALRVSAFSAALDHLTRLLELTPASDPGRSALERQLGDVHYRLGNYAAAQSALDKALAIATTDADRSATRALLAHITAQKGDYDGAKAILLDTVPLARASGDTAILSSALYALGTVHWRLGKVDEMVAVFEESLAMAQAVGDVSGELTALNGLGVAFLHTNGEKAERLFSEVVRRADEVGNRERVMIALANLGVLEDERANDIAARDYHSQALAISRELGTQYYIAHHLSNLAGSEVALGDIGNAKVHNDEALALAHRIGTTYVLVQALCNTVEIAYAEGDRAWALALVGLMRRQAAWSSEDTHWINTLIVQWGISTAEAEAGMAKGEELIGKQPSKIYSRGIETMGAADAGLKFVTELPTVPLMLQRKMWKTWSIHTNVES